MKWNRRLIGSGFLHECRLSKFSVHLLRWMSSLGLGFSQGYISFSHDHEPKAQNRNAKITNLYSVLFPFCFLLFFCFTPIGTSRPPHSRRPGHQIVNQVCVTGVYSSMSEEVEKAHPSRILFFQDPPSEEPLLQRLMHWGTDTGGTSLYQPRERIFQVPLGR